MVHEIKFLIPADKTPEILAWARQNLEPDSHGTGDHSDEYFVQSIYFDTPEWHVFRKAGSYGRAKYRARRYGNNEWLFLERKLKRTGLVRKRRTAAPLDALKRLDSFDSAEWYRKRLAVRKLAPTCYIEYERVARQTMTMDGLLRLTVDRALRFETDVGWRWPGNGGKPFLTECAILELKFAQLPALAKRLIEQFSLNSQAASKYRMALRASEHAPQLQGLEADAEPAVTTTPILPD